MFLRMILVSFIFGLQYELYTRDESANLNSNIDLTLSNTDVVLAKFSVTDVKTVS